MMIRGRLKSLVTKNSRGNTRDPKFRGSCDHITVMPVVSAAGQALTTVIVLPGTEVKYHKRGGRFETPADFLSQPNYLFMRPIAGVESDILYD